MEPVAESHSMRQPTKRDAKNIRELHRLGWEVLTLWECELSEAAALARRVRSFLGR